jgi:hypothetical protein
LPGNQGHVHCEHADPEVAFGKDQHKDGMPFSGWASLRNAYDSCPSFGEEDRP